MNQKKYWDLWKAHGTSIQIRNYLWSQWSSGVLRLQRHYLDGRRHKFATCQALFLKFSQKCFFLEIFTCSFCWWSILCRHLSCNLHKESLTGISALLMIDCTFMDALALRRNGMKLMIITWSMATSQVLAKAATSSRCLEESKLTTDNGSSITTSTSTTSAHAPITLDPEGEKLPSGQGSRLDAAPGQ